MIAEQSKRLLQRHSSLEQAIAGSIPSLDRKKEE